MVPTFFHRSRFWVNSLKLDLVLTTCADVHIVHPRFTVSGLSSVLSHPVTSEMDFGLLTCSASNSEGETAEGCGVRVVPARPPQPPANCVVLNQVTLKYPDGHTMTHPATLH